MTHAAFLASDSHAPLLLAAATLFLLLGATLLVFSVRMRRLELSRRLSLVDLQTGLRSGQQRAAKLAVRETLLLHGAAGALPEREQRAIVRFTSALRIPQEYASAFVSASRLSCAAILGLATLVLMSEWHVFAGRGIVLFMAAVAFGIVGWFVPPYFIRAMARSHAKAAANGLPEALELLVVCVEAGLSLEDGIDRMTIELEHSNPQLAEELALTSADLKILPSREAALMKLAERVNVPSVRTVVTTLSQTMRYGTPLAQAMRVVAAEMRNNSVLEMEERANRLPTLMTLPMMLFIMPTIFLVVGGPAALKIMDTFLR